MGIMLFGHARVGMAELLGDYRQGNAFHRKQAAMRVAQDVEGYCRSDVGVFASQQ